MSWLSRRLLSLVPTSPPSGSPGGLARQRCALAIATTLLVTSGGPAAGTAREATGDADPRAAGRLDLAAADRLVAAYARHALSKLPRDWRRAEEERWREHPPGLGPHPVYQLRMPNGTLAFEYDADGRRLHCFALIHKLREGFPSIGLTRREILAALKAHAARGTPTGGGELVWDEPSDGFWLLRTYLEEPASSRQMLREVDRLVEAGEAWFRGHYLEAIRRQMERMRPPESATGSRGDFRATLAVTPDSRTIDLWTKPPTARPRLITRSQVSQESQVYFPIFFSGAAPGADGKARVEAELTVLYPDGSAKAAGGRALLWDAPPPPAGELQYGENSLALPFTTREPLGTYRILARVCDRAAGLCLDLEHPLQVLGPGAR